MEFNVMVALSCLPKDNDTGETMKKLKYELRIRGIAAALALAFTVTTVLPGNVRAGWGGTGFPAVSALCFLSAVHLLGPAEFLL